MFGDRITVWRLIAHHDVPEDAWRWFTQSNRIAIGWGRVGNFKMYHSAQDVAAAIRSSYPDLNNSGSGGVCLYVFCFRVTPGDLVIVSSGGRRTGVMEVQGEYDFNSNPEPEPIGEYQHQRKAEVLLIDPDRLWREAGAGPRAGHNIRWTLIECLKPVDPAAKQRPSGHA